MRSAASAVKGRFFLPSGQVVPKTLPAELAVCDAGIAHHLKTVMRLQPGDRVVAVDGAARRAFDAVLLHLGKDSLTVRLEADRSEGAGPPGTCILAVSLIKEQRWDWLLQKAAELGVTAIQPLVCERTVVDLSGKDVDKKRSRWEAVLRGAAEQSEGLFIPRLETPCTVAALATWPPDTLRILLLERGDQRPSLKAVWQDIPPELPILLAVGPEGGWTEQEAAKLMQAGFQPASLGERILRSETAAMAAVAAWLYERGHHD